MQLNKWKQREARLVSRICLLTTCFVVQILMTCDVVFAQGTAAHQTADTIAEHQESSQRTIRLHAGSPEASSFLPGTIVAEFNDYRITAGDVSFHLNRTVAEKSLKEDALIAGRAAALEFLINRKILLDWARKSRQWPGDSKIKMERTKRLSELESADETLEGFLSTKGISQDMWETELVWGLAWNAFLENLLDDSTLEQHFQQKKRKYDGTRIQVAQILFALAPTENVENVLESARNVKQQIEEGRTTFAAAVREHSVSPSRERDGIVGWMDALGPMPPDFTDYVMDLNPGDLTEPFQTIFGIHLVKCIEIQVGTKQFDDARKQVFEDLAENVFKTTSEELRPSVEVQYNDQYPHFIR
ncbi:MAG: peptidylprolyl isomerase [Pirellulaceae bacterium]